LQALYLIGTKPSILVNCILFTKNSLLSIHVPFNRFLKHSFFYSFLLQIDETFLLFLCDLNSFFFSLGKHCVNGIHMKYNKKLWCCAFGAVEMGEEFFFFFLNVLLERSQTVKNFKKNLVLHLSLFSCI